MTPPVTPKSTLVRDSISGDNTTGHVVTASVVGGALASVLSWLFQLAHLAPPSGVTAAIAVLCTVGASWAMQKLS
jgi:hypothetical protein